MTNRMKSLLNETSKGLYSLPLPEKKGDVEDVEALTSKLRNLLSDLRGFAGKDYAQLSKKGSVNSRPLMGVINSDEELSTIFYTLNELMKKIVKRRAWTTGDIRDVKDEIGDLEQALKERKALAAKV